MSWRDLTESLVIAVVVLVCLYDCAARVFGGNQATVSAVLAEASHRWPVVAFAAGAIAGHVWWPWR